MCVGKEFIRFDLSKKTPNLPVLWHWTLSWPLACELNISLWYAKDDMQHPTCCWNKSFDLSLGFMWTCYKEIKALLSCLKQECFHSKFCWWFWGKLLRNIIDLCRRIFFKRYSWIINLKNALLIFFWNSSLQLRVREHPVLGPYVEGLTV